MPVVAGVLAAVGLAIAASALFPTGPAGRLEPDPGIRIEAPVLVLGAVVLLVVALVATALFGRGRPRRAAARPSAVAPFVSRATPLVAASVGVRSALQTDRGPRAAPVRSAMTACGAGLAGVVAALIFATSLARLVEDPVRYGWNWDYEAALGDHLTDDDALAQAEPVVADDRIDGAFYARIATKPIGHEEC